MVQEQFPAELLKKKKSHEKNLLFVLYIQNLKNNKVEYEILIIICIIIVNKSIACNKFKSKYTLHFATALNQAISIYINPKRMLSLSL